MPESVLVVYREAKKAAPYRDALLAAGVSPVLLAADGSAAPGDFHGLVLTGGTDVDPALYGEGRHAETEEPDPERDALEYTLLQQALARDIPVLAICRGLQLLNVFHGGTLIQHLQPPERHRSGVTDRRRPVHSVAIEPGTLLSSIVDVNALPVNSRHHQAVKNVGRDLRVSAFDPEDKTIEALERPDRRFVLAVQWHPEDQTRDPRQMNLFRRFGAAVNE